MRHAYILRLKYNIIPRIHQLQLCFLVFIMQKSWHKFPLNKIFKRKLEYLIKSSQWLWSVRYIISNYASRNWFKKTSSVKKLNLLKEGFWILMLWISQQEVVTSQKTNLFISSLNSFSFSGKNVPDLPNYSYKTGDRGIHDVKVLECIARKSTMIKTRHFNKFTLW